MADNMNDNFNGHMAELSNIDDELAQAYAKADAQAIVIQQLGTQLLNAQQAVDFWKQRFWAVVEALGYDKSDFEAGKIALADIILYARACDTGDFV